MKFYFAILLAVATTDQTQAFSTSRKAFLAKAATTSAAIIATTPTIASAREGAFQRAVKEKKSAKEKYGEYKCFSVHILCVSLMHNLVCIC